MRSIGPLSASLFLDLEGEADQRSYYPEGLQLHNLKNLSFGSIGTIKTAALGGNTAINTCGSRRCQGKKQKNKFAQQTGEKKSGPGTKSKTKVATCKLASWRTSEVYTENDYLLCYFGCLRETRMR